MNTTALESSIVAPQRVADSRREAPGPVTYDAKDPDTHFPPIRDLRPPTGSPNVLVILIDDVGYGTSSRHSVSWRFAALYIWNRSRDTTTEPFTTSEAIVDLQLKRVSNVSKHKATTQHRFLQSAFVNS